MPESRLLVLALPGGKDLAQRLAARLACPWRDLEVHTFPDGETLVRIDAPVQGCCVVLAGSLDRPDAKTLPLLFAADAARELGAARVGLVAPYLAYMRQDMRFRPGEAITSGTYARLLSAAVDFLVTVDPHLHRWRTLGELYRIPARVVPSAPAVAGWLRDHVPAPLVIGPDGESRQWVSEVARLSGAPWTVMAKTRRGDRDVAVAMETTGPWPDRSPVLLDDIVSSGGTLVAAAVALQAAGLPPPMCIAVHALLDSDAEAALRRAGVTRLVSCDTVAHSSNAIRLAPALAEAVKELATHPGVGRS